MRHLIATDLAYFPERLHRMVIINAPWYFPALYNLFKPFIDPRTREKIIIMGADYASTLLEYIDLSQIPADFGGEDETCEWGRPNVATDTSGFSLPDMYERQILQLENPKACNYRLTPEEMTSLHLSFTHPKYKDDERTMQMRGLLEK